MQIIDGRALSKLILIELKSLVSTLPFQPVFCDILVGNDPVSKQYVDLKAKKAEEIGIKFLNANLPETIPTLELIQEIQHLNAEQNMCGLILQLPLPHQINRSEVLNAIDPKIDVDCMGQNRSKRFYEGDLFLVPPTAGAVIYMLKSLNLSLESKNILVVGQGELVGRPVTFLLKAMGLHPQICDIRTKNPAYLMQSADIIISAVGKPKLINAEKIKKGVIIIDAGTSEDEGSIVGDVDTLSVASLAEAISPVPGGVGPLTVAMLLSNVCKVAEEIINYRTYVSPPSGRAKPDPSGGF